jgi:putative hemolysin
MLGDRPSEALRAWLRFVEVLRPKRVAHSKILVAQNLMDSNSTWKGEVSLLVAPRHSSKASGCVSVSKTVSGLNLFCRSSRSFSIFALSDRKTDPWALVVFPVLLDSIG